MGSSLRIVVVFFFFFLLHDKKAAKHVVLRRNFKVSKIDLARCFTFETVCLYQAVSQREGGRNEI